MANAIKWIVVWMIGGLVSALPEFLRRIFGFLGVGLVTMTGLNYVEQLLIDKFKEQLFGVPITILDFLGMFRIDDAFSLLISAWVVRRMLDGWSGSGPNYHKDVFTAGKGGLGDLWHGRDRINM